MCDKLQEIVDGKLKSLMVFMPPGSAKSTYCSIRFPSYYLGCNPSHDLVQCSNTSELASRFGRKTRNLIDTKRYRTIFDVQLAKDSQAKNQWEVVPGGDEEKPGGEYYAAGVEGAITGRRANGGLIDDPVKGREDADSERTSEKTWDWYLTEFLTRIKPGGWKIIIQTRWAEIDLSGRILPEDWDGESGLIEARNGEVWYVLCLPAKAQENDVLGRKVGEWLWPEYVPIEHWEQQEKTQFPRDWSALYQQNPTPEEGTYFKREYFKRFRLGEEPEHLRKYQTSDFAVTEDSEADFTVFGEWGVDNKGHWWLLDRYKDQVTAATWVKILVSNWFERNPMMFIGETGVIRRAVEPLIRQQMQETYNYVPLEWITRNRDKVAMAAAFRGMVELGMVHIPQTEWGEDVLTELLKFPAGAHDDQVDMCTLVGLAVNQGVLATVPESEETKPPNKWDKAFEDAETADEGFI